MLACLLLLATVTCVPPDPSMQAVGESGLQACRTRLALQWGFELDASQLILAGTRRIYSQQVQRYSGRPPPEWSRAVALPAQNRIILSVDPSDQTHGRSMLDVLAHELVHLGLGGLAVPRWFDEGLAEIASRRMLSDAEQRSLQRWAEQGLLREWHVLRDDFPSHAERAQTAYLQALAFCRYLDTQGEGLQGILASVRNGADFDSAVQESCGQPLQGLQRSWEQGEAQNYSFFWDQLNELGVYGLLGLLVIVAWLVERFRRRRKHELLPD